MCVEKKHELWPHPYGDRVAPTEMAKNISKVLKENMASYTQEGLSESEKIQAILWLCKPLRNFHSSSVLLYLCVQEESYSRRSPHPPLAELAPPSASQPAPPCGESVLFGWAWDQPVGVRAREPSWLPWPGLDRNVPPVPGSGRVKDRPPYLLLQWASLCHTAWNTAGADLLRVRSSARRDRINSKEPAA